MSGGPEPRCHVQGVRWGQFELDMGGVQGRGDGVEKTLFGVLSEFQDSGQDGVPGRGETCRIGLCRASVAGGGAFVVAWEGGGIVGGWWGGGACWRANGRTTEGLTEGQRNGSWFDGQTEEQNRAGKKRYLAQTNIQTVNCDISKLINIES